MKHLVMVLLAISLGGATVAETEKSAKPEKQEAASKPAKNSDGSKPETKQTPFGPVEAKPSDPLPAAELSSDPFVSAEQKGEVVIFRRRTPFGAQVWKKKRSELTADEQAILARGPQQEEKPPAVKPKTASKKRPRKAKASDKH